MGKTALAIQYAHAYADFYPGGRWLVGCAGISTLVQAIRSLDSDLGIQFTDEEKLDETRAAKRVLSVLQQKAEDGAKARAGEKKPPEPKVLLILDNVDAPALLQPPGTDLISGRRWLHAIVTTRLNPEALGADQALHCHLPVDELPEEDAIRLIESWQPMGLFLNDMERNAALGIARLLGGFTLAIEVAAVYLADSRGRVTCSALLQRLEKQGVDPVGRETKSGIRHAEKLISATLTPTLETLETRENFVLTLAALLPPDAIVLPWLKATAAKKYPEFATDAEPGYIDPWLSIINHLLGLRLLQALDWTDDGKTLRICRMHRLVQTVVRQSTGDAQNPLLLVLVEIASERAEFLCNEEGWLDWNNRWEIHPLGQLALHLLDDGKDEEIAAYLASVVATLLHNLGDWEGAQLLDVRALEARERVLGAEHPDTLLGMSNLATLLHNKGEHEKAQPLFERALEVQERVLGLEHPDTLWSVNKLAAYFCSNGNFEKAHHLLDRAQEACERILGSEHPDTLYSVNILAALFHNKGDHEKALSLYERALEARERVLGSEHPDTLISVNNLAKLFHDKGEFEKAQTLYERALEGYERVLGPEHPNTLMIVDDLAVFFYNKGEFEKAQPLYERVLEARERVLGSEHPDTLLNISNLATLLHNKGDHEKALSLHERALEARERVLGSEHPDTLMSVSNLAGLFHDKGEFEKAQPLYERALEARERVLGPEHPSTLLSMSNLAGLFHDKGEFEKAQPLYERALEARERVLGVEHPSTKIVRRNLEILFDTIRQ
ncbi:MAG: hypothetical protein ACD_75C02639G0004 [uncultured bacterium]|nr:MAG: hypothetical protein ACD_75C02639G0004 [uncultured bacterium]